MDFIRKLFYILRSFLVKYTFVFNKIFILKLIYVKIVYFYSETKEFKLFCLQLIVQEGYCH